MNDTYAIIWEDLYEIIDALDNAPPAIGLDTNQLRTTLENHLITSINTHRKEHGFPTSQEMRDIFGRYDGDWMIMGLECMRVGQQQIVDHLRENGGTQ